MRGFRHLGIERIFEIIMVVLRNLEHFIRYLIGELEIIGDLGMLKKVALTDGTFRPYIVKFSVESTDGYAPIFKCCLCLDKLLSLDLKGQLESEKFPEHCLVLILEGFHDVITADNLYTRGGLLVFVCFRV